MSNRSQVSRLRPAGQFFSSGFTLVELMIVMVVVAIGVALATPTFENIAQRRQTTSEAEQLAAFLSIAQSEAVKRNELVSIRFIHDSDTDWCVGASTGTADCNCKLMEDPDVSDDPDGNADLFCDIGGVSGISGPGHIMNNSDFNKSKMVTYSGDPDTNFNNFAFDPIRGSITAVNAATVLPADLAPRTFAMQSENGDYQLQVEITVVGRIRICNSDSTKEVPGYPDC